MCHMLSHLIGTVRVWHRRPDQEEGQDCDSDSRGDLQPRMRPRSMSRLAPISPHLSTSAVILSVVSAGSWCSGGGVQLTVLVHTEPRVFSRSLS
jgi:hypothetical protein